MTRCGQYQDIRKHSQSRIVVTVSKSAEEVKAAAIPRVPNTPGKDIIRVIEKCKKHIPLYLLRPSPIF